MNTKPMKHKTIHSTFKRLLFAALAASSFAALADLPEGCNLVEYLRGDGEAYIQLDFPLTHEQTVTMEFVCRNKAGSRGVLGARESASANNCGILTGASLMMDYGDYNLTRIFSKDYKTGVRYRATLGANLREVREVDSGSVLFSKAEHVDLTFTTPMNCAVFFFNNNLQDVGKFDGDVCSVVISKTATGEVEHDLVPVAKDGVGYLCDRITGKLYGNASNLGRFRFRSKVPAVEFDADDVTSDKIGLPDYRSVVTVNYVGKETLAFFPVLVRLSPERVDAFSYDQLASPGDLSFCHSDGTLYPFDVDTWNPDGESLVWVRVPQLKPGKTQFFMRWGHASVPANVPAETWEDNYAAVFHFNGTGMDATGFGLAQTTGGWLAQKTDSALGGCYAISAGGVYVAPPWGRVSDVANITISGWYKKTVAEEPTMRLLSSKTDAKGIGFELISVDGNIWLRGSGNANTMTTERCPRTWLQQSEWSHLVGRYAGESATLFVNGENTASGSVDAVEVGSDPSAWPNVGVGNYGKAYMSHLDNSFQGLVDEVRIYNGVASDEWIAAEHKTVEDDQFVRVGSAFVTRRAIAYARISNVTTKRFSVDVVLNEIEGDKNVVVRWGASPDAQSESYVICKAKSGATVSTTVTRPIPANQTTYFLVSVEGNGSIEPYALGASGFFLALPEDGSAVPSDEYGRPAYRAVVSVDGGSVDSKLENFPVLMRISEQRIPGFRYEDVKSSADISFADYSGEPYPCEVDTWNPNGESLVWVRVPVVSNTNATQFYFRWGHRKPLTNDPTAVWTKYAAVFHFNGAVTDATGNGLKLEATDAAVATDAALGGCYEIDGTHDSCVSLDPPYGYLSTPANMTVSGWFKKSTQKDDVARLLSGKGAAGDDSFELIAYSDGNIWMRGSGNANTVKTDGRERTWLFNGEWSHLVGRYEGTSAKLYVNGLGVVTGTVGAMASSAVTIGVGNAGGGTGNNPFRGLADEVRFYNGVAPDAWVKAEYKTATLSSFATFGEGVPVKQARGLKILFY